MSFVSVAAALAPTAASPPSTPLRGRDAERYALGEALGRLVTGRGCVVIVEGAAGIGKTRLLAEATVIGRRLGLHVSCATAAAGHRVVPMGALLEAVEGGATPLLADLPRPEAVSDVRYWLIHELETALERRATQGPLMIVVDDLQWADGSTTAAVEVLSTRLAELPVAWVVALRTEEASAELVAGLDRMVADGALRLRLEPLDDRAVFELVTDLSGAPPDPGMGELAAGARGVPFWLFELLIALREAGRIEHAGGFARVRAGELPARTWATTRDRLDRMTPAARELVSVGSVLGQRFSFSSLQRMLGATPTSLLAPLDELLRSGVLVEDSEHLAFRHDLLREGVLASIPASARQALERQAADVLLESGAPPVEVALWLADSAHPGDLEAISVLERAVQTLSASDPDTAAELARRTLELTPRDDPRRAALVADTAVLLHAAGRVHDAMRFADTALGELLSPAQESEVRFGISTMFSLSADVRAEANRRALALAGLDDGDRARHQASLLHNLQAAGRRRAVRALLAEVGDRVRASRDPRTRFTLQLAEAGVLYDEGRFADALGMVEAAGRAAAGDAARARVAEQWRSELLAMLDRFEEATRISAQGLAAAQRESQAWAIHLWERWRGRQMSQLGEYQDAIAMLESTFRTAEMRPGFGANDASALSALATAALHVGDRRNLQRCEEIATLALADATPELRRHAGWALAQQAMAAGDVAKAHAHLAQLVAAAGPDESILPSFPSDVTDQPHLVRIALAAEDEALARRATELAEQRAMLNPDVASVVGAARHARGLLDADRQTLELAIEAFERSPRRPPLASVLEDAAVAAQRDGAKERAVGLLDRALEMTTEMDARWDANRLRLRLRLLGVRRRVVIPERPTRGWEALTASELAVVRAITGGMTNREAAEALFLSPHTVGSHLRHVFAKLNINSRVELARMAGEHA